MDAVRRAPTINPNGCPPRVSPRRETRATNVDKATDTLSPPPASRSPRSWRGAERGASVSAGSTAPWRGGWRCRATASQSSNMKPLAVPSARFSSAQSTTVCQPAGAAHQRQRAISGRRAASGRRARRLGTRITSAPPMMRWEKIRDSRSAPQPARDSRRRRPETPVAAPHRRRPAAPAARPAPAVQAMRCSTSPDLLAGQTAHYCEHRQRFVHLQPHGLLQMQLVFDLAFQIVGVVAGTQPRVVAGSQILSSTPLRMPLSLPCRCRSCSSPLHAIAELRPGDLAHRSG